jgi:RNA polymerase sigma-70 factor (ECF subfamily)
MATAFTLPRCERPVDLTRLSDEALAAASRSSSRAGELLYRRHGAAVSRFCLSILHDPDEASDAAHDAWLRALTALAGGADPSDFKAWLFAIARNRCTDSFRVVRTQDLDGLADDLVHPGTPVDERHEQQAQLDALWADLRSLSDAQRSAFVMSELFGMTGDELACSMRRPAPSCRSLAADARTAVRERQRGRESGCDDIRARMRTSRGDSRLIDAHLEVCAGCRREARHERARRLIRSLAVIPVPVPGLPRLRAAQAWLGTLISPAGSLDRFSAAVGATAVAAAIGVGATTGGASGTRPDTPTPPAVVHAAAHGGPATQIIAVRQRRKSSPVLRSRTREHPQTSPPAGTHPRPAAPAGRITPPRAPSPPDTPRKPRPVQRTADELARLVVAALPRPTRVTTGLSSGAAVVDTLDKVTPTVTGALSRFSPPPNP